MDKLTLTKSLVNIVVGVGTSRIVAQVIKNNTTPESITDQVTMLSGALVLGSLAADATKKHTNDKIDEIADWWKQNVNKN